MKNVETIKGISDIISQYEVFILDQWGVMHDGKKGYPQAIRCVEKLYQEKKKIIIISNSSRRKKFTIKILPKLGFDPKHFIEVITSGEMIWQSLNNENHVFTKNLKKNCYYINDQKKSEQKFFIYGLEKFNFVKKIEDAHFILACTPFAEFSIIDYIPLLTKALDKNLPFICANPDYESVENNSKEINFRMGTIAQLYKSLGGEIFILGKPEKEIYIQSTKKIKKLNKSKVIAVGDSMYHDIQGANLFGVDSILITSGVHQSSFNKKKPRWDANINQVYNLGISPTFLCSKFQI